MVRTRTQVVLLAAIFYMAASSTTALAAESEPSCWRRCWDNFLRFCSLKNCTTRLKTDCRACVNNWYRDQPTPEYGMRLLDQPQRMRATGRLVVFIHGLNSRPEDLSAIIDETRKLGHPCATLRYPNDQAIKESAELLGDRLLALKRSDPELRISLVTHSMGGLIARAVIEDDRLDPGNVRRLIMLVPPNRGSQLARYACGMDLCEFVTSGSRRGEASLIHGSFVDGMSEAIDDLQPGSRFLTKLNNRKRNPNVRYTVVLGTRAPLNSSDLATLQKKLDKAGRRCSWVRCFERRFDAQLEKLPELIDGQGDGIVSVGRGRLPGVTDELIGDFTHMQILEKTPTAEVQRMRNDILSRL